MSGHLSQMIGGELLMRLRVEQTLSEYYAAIDSDRLEEWANYFVEDGAYRVTTRENFDQNLPLSLMSCKGRGMFRDRILALRTANIFEPHVYCHIPGWMRVESVSTDLIKTQSSFSVIRTMHDGAAMLFASGRSFDTFKDVGGHLMLSERVVVLDSRQIDTLLVIPL
jgi:anthranilate 1,2-dioxygenase small subunit